MKKTPKKVLAVLLSVFVLMLTFASSAYAAEMDGSVFLAFSKNGDDVDLSVAALIDADSSGGLVVTSYSELAIGNGDTLVVYEPGSDETYEAELVAYSETADVAFLYFAAKGMSKFLPSVIDMTPGEIAGAAKEGVVANIISTDGDTFKINSDIPLLGDTGTLDDGTELNALKGYAKKFPVGSLIYTDDNDLVGMLTCYYSGENAMFISYTEMISVLDILLEENQNNSSYNPDSTKNLLILFAVIAIVLLVLIVYSIGKKKSGSKNDNSYADLNGVVGESGERVCIVGSGGHFNGQKFEILGDLVVGRHAGRCNLAYPESEHGISGVHCKITPRGESIVLVDLGSTYGTFVNGSRIAPNTEVLLNPGQSFYLADPRNTFAVTK